LLVFINELSLQKRVLHCIVVTQTVLNLEIVDEEQTMVQTNSLNYSVEQMDMFCPTFRSEYKTKLKRIKPLPAKTSLSSDGTQTMESCESRNEE